MEKSRLDLLKEKIAEFEQVQWDVGCGATDTEPDYEWQRALKVAVIDGLKSIPSTGREWNLLTVSYPADEIAAAAKTLHDKAEEVVDFVLDTKLREVNELRNYINDYAWRVY